MQFHDKKKSHMYMIKNTPEEQELTSGIILPSKFISQMKYTFIAMCL